MAVRGREVLTPADIAARYGVSGGHIHHAEHALDQLVIRPTLETMRYATPVAGLFCAARARTRVAASPARRARSARPRFSRPLTFSRNRAT